MKSKGKPWTTEEKKMLSEEYFRCPVDILSERLGRSSSSVRTMALMLGLRKRGIKKTQNEEYRFYSLEKTGDVVYFIESSDGYVKIGKTNLERIQWRFNEIQSCNQHELRYKVIIEGPRWLESVYQNYFYIYHFRGEWFKKEGLLEDFINKKVSIWIPFDRRDANGTH